MLISHTVTVLFWKLTVILAADFLIKWLHQKKASGQEQSKGNSVYASYIATRNYSRLFKLFNYQQILLTQL